MQSGWRLYAGMIGLAALTGTVVALALSGGPRLPSEPQRRPSPSESATASPSAFAEASPSPAPSESPSPTPSELPTDPLQAIRPLVFAWRPADTTAIVETEGGGGLRIVAVGLGGTTATPLLELPSGTEWQIRRDGSAIAFTVRVDAILDRTRIAALNLQTGALGWVTPDEPSAAQRSPFWSDDGSVVYYTRTSYDRKSDLGIYRVRVDGTNLTQLRPPSADGEISVVGLTPDGLGLVLDRSVISGVVDVLDLNTRAVRSFIPPPSTLPGQRSGGQAEAWRPQRPRALLSFRGVESGQRLYLWDDLAATPAPSPSASPAPTPSPLVRDVFTLGADWDPTGARIVAALSSGGAASLVLMDANGRDRKTLEGTQGASRPFWLRAGIVYLYGTGERASEVRIVAPDGTSAPRALFSGGVTRLTYVTP